MDTKQLYGVVLLGLDAQTALGEWGDAQTRMLLRQQIETEERVLFVVVGLDLLRRVAVILRIVIVLNVQAQFHRLEKAR